jgi:hypothetical protein
MDRQIKSHLESLLVPDGCKLGSQQYMAQASANCGEFRSVQTVLFQYLRKCTHQGTSAHCATARTIVLDGRNDIEGTQGHVSPS